MSIPGATDAPGAELAYRVHDLVPESETLVVVNCAGRTRSIIGAQSLINAGIPNRVVALQNGTMGWHLAGFGLEHGQESRYGPISQAGLDRARRAAAGVAKRFGVRAIERRELDRLRQEAGQRTLYLLDVRSPEEYEAGHLPGSLSAPGGQLVQETESWVPVLGARIVLIDDTGVRATMTAHWLVQMGWEAYVLKDALAGQALVQGAYRAAIPAIGQVAEAGLTPQDVQPLLASGRAVVVDFGFSRDYAKGHIPGAWFAIRSRLPSSLPRLPAAEMLVFTSADGVLARLAAPEASQLTATPVRVLTGGTAAWRAAGLPLASGLEHLADGRDDVWLRPYENTGDVERHMRDYLTWELDLVREIERDGDHRFRLFPVQGAG